VASLERPAAEAGPVAVPPALPRRRNGRAFAAGGAAVLVLAGAAAAIRFGPGARPAASPTAGASAPVALAKVVQGTLTSQQQIAGVVQYISEAPYASGNADLPVVNEEPGVVTALPALGQTVRQGQALYGVGGAPVLLLYGPVPAYRGLALGLSGPDVRELNADLVAQGDAPAAALPPASDAFSAATAAALERLQRKAGLPVTGQLPLGEALFLPGAVRIASVEPGLGASLSPGQTVLETTSDTEQVVAQVDPSQAALLKVGQPATITFSDGSTATGRIGGVAKVATSASPNSSPTVEVDVAPTKAGALNSLDNASVQVSIITASVQDALAVPVTALLAQAGGGYAVEVAAADGTHALVPVTLGIFDDAAGLVQVTGKGLAGGDHVVVAGT